MNHSFSSSFRKAILFLFSLGIALSLASGAFAATKEQAPVRGSADYEAWLTKKVHHELAMLPFYSVFDNLQYKVDGSTVILVGQVARPALKDDAGSAVRHIEGVTTVNNHIEVLPLSPNDDRIRRAEFRAIYSFPTLQMYELRAVPSIHIIVKNGNVTLEGGVATQAEKDTANVVANSVPGVFSVTNNLQVEKS